MVVLPRRDTRFIWPEARRPWSTCGIILNRKEKSKEAQKFYLGWIKSIPMRRALEIITNELIQPETAARDNWMKQWRFPFEYKMYNRSLATTKRSATPFSSGCQWYGHLFLIPIERSIWNCLTQEAKTQAIKPECAWPGRARDHQPESRGVPKRLKATPPCPTWPTWFAAKAAAN